MHTTKEKILQISGADLSLPKKYICVPRKSSFLPSKLASQRLWARIVRRRCAHVIYPSGALTRILNYKKRKYNFKNLEILLEVRKNLKNLVKKDDKTTSAILDGNIVDNNGQNVISYGEIVKTSTLRILSDVFEIRKPLTILRVSKKINSTKANKFN